MKALRPAASRLGLRSSTARRSKPLRKLNATARAVEGNLGGFCVCEQKRPQRGLRAEAACVRTPAGWEPWGQGWRAEVLALRYELGRLFAAIPLGPLQALILGLRIADGFGQHLAQLSLRLRRFALRWLPLVHK